jgi:hypothetical protein
MKHYIIYIWKKLLCKYVYEKNGTVRLLWTQEAVQKKKKQKKKRPSTNLSLLRILSSPVKKLNSNNK